MIRKPLSWNVKQICAMIDRGTISFNHPLQRPGNQWKIEDQSLLIHSLLTMFMPDIYAIQIKTEKGNTYDIIDGKQRLTTIYSYLNDEWVLTDLEPIKLDSTNEIYDISGKKFSELPEVVQEEIKGYTVTIKAIELEEDDDEENIIEDIFYRLNNGKAVSREHLALISAKRNVQEFVRRMVTENNLFTKVAHFPPGAIKKSNREMSVLQSIVLVSGLDYNSFAAKDIEKFFVENNISNGVLGKVESLFNNLASIFNNEYSKFVNKINISSLVALLNVVEDTEKVQEFILWYSKNAKKDDNYKQYCGAGCTKKENVRGRINALIEMYNNFK